MRELARTFNIAEAGAGSYRLLANFDLPLQQTAAW
jgi:hypothetical protein